MSGSARKSVSKNYVAKIVAGEKRIGLVGLHFLAFPNRLDRKPEREAQADAVRCMALDLIGEGWLPVVLGDFNDYEEHPDAVDHRTNAPITRVLQQIRELRVEDPEDDLVNIARFIPLSERYTAFWDSNRNGSVNAPGEFTSIDHILIAPGLAAFVEHAEIGHRHDPRFVSDHFPVVVTLRFEDAAPLVPDGTGNLRIESLYPNPPGNESMEEAAALINLGTASVDLAGWRLRDKAGKHWELDLLGTLAAGESKSMRRNGQPMALNNDGDTVDLLDPEEKVVHSVTYSYVNEGELVTPALPE